jgi:hypothetical protein
LAVRIRDAVPDIESTMQRALLAWPQAQCVSEGFNVYVDSVALNLHGFYSGIELFTKAKIRSIPGKDKSLPTASSMGKRCILAVTSTIVSQSLGMGLTASSNSY